MQTDIQQIRNLAARVRRNTDTRNYNKLMDRARNMAQAMWPRAHARMIRLMERDCVVGCAFIAEDPYVRLVAMPAIIRARQLRNDFYGLITIYCRQLPRGKRVVQTFAGFGRFKFPSPIAWASFMFHPALLRIWTTATNPPIRLVPSPVHTLSN